MTMKKHQQTIPAWLRNTCWVMCTLLILTGCTSGNKKAAKFTADPAAFEFAIRQAAELQHYAQGCANIDAGLKTLASEATNAWNQRNWAQVDAADIQYSRQLAEHTTTYNGKKVALPAVKLLGSVEKIANLKLDQTRHSINNIVGYCQKKLIAYRDGAQDLSVINPNADLYLKSLATPGAASTAYKVPSLAADLKPSSAPGKSQFNLERELASWNCAGGEILTFLNEWPSEAYGAFCPSGKAIFVSCEWGQCTIINP